MKCAAAGGFRTHVNNYTYVQLYSYNYSTVSCLLAVQNRCVQYLRHFFVQCISQMLVEYMAIGVNNGTWIQEFWNDLKEGSKSHPKHLLKKFNCFLLVYKSSTVRMTQWETFSIGIRRHSIRILCIYVHIILLPVYIMELLLTCLPLLWMLWKTPLRVRMREEGRGRFQMYGEWRNALSVWRNWFYNITLHSLCFSILHTRNHSSTPDVTHSYRL